MGTGHPSSQPHTHTQEESRRTNETHYEEIPGAQGPSGTERDSNGVQSQTEQESIQQPRYTSHAQYIDSVPNLPQINESSTTYV